MAFLATLRTEVKRLADLFGTSLPVAFGMWFAQTELEIDDD